VATVLSETTASDEVSRSGVLREREIDKSDTRKKSARENVGARVRARARARTAHTTAFLVQEIIKSKRKIDSKSESACAHTSCT